MRKLSALGWNAYEDFDGDHFARLKYGYGKLIENFGQQIPEESIKLNEVVEKIDWTSGHNQVSVYNKVENTRKVYDCSYVLCTVPLGYLKKMHHELFFPKLPLNKIKAIENLGFGCVNKLFLVFEYPILKENFEGLQILWRDDIGFNLEYSSRKWNLNVLYLNFENFNPICIKFFILLNKDDKFYKAFDNFEVLPKMSNVLICFVCGEDAKYIETLQDECLLDVIHEIFNKCFTQLKIPKPIKIIRYFLKIN